MFISFRFPAFNLCNVAASICYLISRTPSWFFAVVFLQTTGHVFSTDIGALSLKMINLDNSFTQDGFEDMVTQDRFSGFIKQYHAIVFKGILRIGQDQVDSLTYWRINILFSILFAGVVFGIPIFAFFIRVAIHESLWGLLLIDLLAMISALFLLFFPGISLNVRSIIALFTTYGIGLFVIIHVGPLSGGPAWLFCFAVLSGVLLGSRAAILAIALNSATVILLAFLQIQGIWGAAFPTFHSHQLMIVGLGNFIFLNTLAAISVSVLVKGLTQSHKKEIRLTESLRREKMKLLQTQRNLETEILEHKNTEKALRRSEEKYRYLFNHAPVGIYEIDFTRFKFVEVNAVLCAWSGYTSEEMLAMDPMQFLTDESRAVFVKRFEKLMKGHELEKEMEYEIVTKDGNRLTVLLSNDYLYEDGTLTGARVVVHDITERKKMQSMIIQSEKMMSVGGLAAGMAHEINNPLAGMMQNAQVIKNRLTKPIPANEAAAGEAGISMKAIGRYVEKRDIDQQLDRIGEAGRRAAGIVENMLSFARKSDTKKQYHHLDGIVDKAIALAQNDYSLRRKYNFKKIDVIRQFAGDIPAIACDKSKIQQVVFNIFKNAVEAMAQSGQDDPKVVLIIAKEQGRVRLEIQDNGPGMDADTKRRIFEPFYTTKSVGEGTGLGLSVSYFIIVEDHGGEMTVESGPGKGSRFVIKLPRRHDEL